MLCDCWRKIRTPHYSFPKEKDGKLGQSHQCIVRHHENFAALLKSADSGCELCSLFRPFVEHAQLRQQGGVYIAASDCTDSDGSGFTYEDPFLTDIECSSGSDFESGSGNDTDHDDSTKEPNELDTEVKESSHHESKAHSESDGVKEPEQNHEILRWLLLNKAYATSPEQLWVTGSCQDGDKNSQTQSREAMSMISLSAGSIQGINISRNEACYCLDGVWLENRQALAINAPGLWKWRYEPLKIRAGRKRPLRALRPNFELFQYRDKALDLDPPVLGRNVVEDPNSEKAFAVIRNWWDDCKLSHATCPTAWESEVELPTRVIDLGPPSKPLRPRLYQITSGKGPKGEYYATLSHCWGSDTSAITRTVRANLEDMQREIDMTTLSRNFKDAILVSRGLKIRFLWIDALCIIQDSDEDWAQESRQMAKYYRNASIMISALASPGAQHGILVPRLADRQAVQLSPSHAEVFVRLIMDDVVSLTRSSAHSSTSDTRPQLEDIPPFQRAWTLQERVLCRRIVHYSEQQMIWQCKTCLLSEDGQYSSNETTRTKGKLVDLLDVDSQSRVATPFSLRWHHLVTEFTGRRLTYDSDKLPALSGIASEVARLTGDKHLAGLWQRRIRDELLWETLGDGHTSEKDISRIQNGSPTWSWASIKGAVTNDIIGVNRVPRDYDPRFLKLGVTLTTSDPFGRVSGGIIVVSAMCHTYTGPETFCKEGKVFKPKTNREELPASDASGLQDESSRSEHGSDSDSDDYNQFQKLDVFDKKYDWVSQPHIIVCLGEYNYDWGRVNPAWKDATNKYGEQEFLLLRPVGRKDLSTYERVGKATTEHQKRLPIIEAKGWTRRAITLV